MTVSINALLLIGRSRKAKRMVLFFPFSLTSVGDSPFALLLLCGIVVLEVRTCAAIPVLVLALMEANFFIFLLFP